MTDTTHEAPERIYLDGDVEAGDGMFPRCFENPKYASEPQVEYVRADLVQAAVAAALKEAAGGMLAYASSVNLQAASPSEIAETLNEMERIILALITPDAQAALDRYAKERQSEKDMLRKHLKKRFDVLHGGRE